jgi:hypothetical protein
LEDQAGAVLNGDNFGWDGSKEEYQSFFKAEMVDRVEELRERFCGSMGHGNCESVFEHNVKVLGGFIEACGEVSDAGLALREFSRQIRAAGESVGEDPYAEVGRVVGRFFELVLEAHGCCRDCGGRVE